MQMSARYDKTDQLCTGLSILVLAREYENKLFSCYFESYSRLFSHPIFLITFIGVRLLTSALELFYGCSWQLQVAVYSVLCFSTALYCLQCRIPSRE
jgi:hypothetical protein